MADKSWLQKINPFTPRSELKSLQGKLDLIAGEMQDLSAYDVKFAESDGYGNSNGMFNVSGVDQSIDANTLAKAYTSETWVYIAVNAIAQTIVGLPLKLEKRRQLTVSVDNELTGKPESVVQEQWVDASGEKLFRKFTHPNPFCTKAEFYNLLLIDLLTAGEYFIYLDSDEDLEEIAEAVSFDDEEPDSPFGRLRRAVLADTKVKGMYRLPPGLMTVVENDDGFGVCGYMISGPEGKYVYHRAEIIHVKLPNPLDPNRGLSPLVAAYKPVLLDKFATDNMLRFWKSGAKLGGVIETGKALNKEQISRFQRSFENNYTGKNNQHRTLMLPPGMTYKPIEQNPATTALLEFSKSNRDAILGVYRVPPIKAGVLDNANYANARAQLKTFFNDTIKPILTFVEDGFNLKSILLPDSDNVRMKFDLSQEQSLQEDLKEQADAGKEMLEAGLSVNEVRKKVWKMNPVKDGDKIKVIEDMNKPSGAFPVGLSATPSALKDGEATAPGPLDGMPGPSVTSIMNVVGRCQKGRISKEAAAQLLLSVYSLPKATIESMLDYKFPEEVKAPEQPDAAAAASDIDATGGTFSDRVRALVGQFVAEGMPVDLAVAKAIEQALLEGFTPDETDPDDDGSDPEGGDDNGGDGEGEPLPAKTLDTFITEELEKLGETPITSETVAGIIARFNSGEAELQLAVTDGKQYAHGVTKAQIEGHFKSVEEKTNPLIEARLTEVQKFFSAVEAKLLKKLGSGEKSYGKTKDAEDDDLDDLTNLDAYEAEMKAYIDEVDQSLKAAYDYGYGSTYAKVEFNVPNAPAEKFLRAYGAREVKYISDTTRTQMRTLLADSFKSQDTIQETSQKIRDKFVEIKVGRAMTIARTEVLTAVSVSRQEKRADVKAEFPEKQLKKMWLASKKVHYREDHEAIDGETVDADATFSIGLKYPREPGGEPGDVINCGCDCIDVMAEDADSVRDTAAIPNPNINYDKGGPGSGPHPGHGRRPKPTSERPTAVEPAPSAAPAATPAAPSSEPTAPAPKPVYVDRVEGDHKVSAAIQEGYATYRSKVGPIISDTVIPQRNQGSTKIKLSKEQRDQLKAAVKEFDGVKSQFMRDNGMSPKQIGAMKQVTKSWVKDSDSTDALVFRQVVSELNGGNFANERAYGGKVSPELKRMVEIKRSSMEKAVGGPEKLVAAVKAEIAFNQASYRMDAKDQGITIYRGVRTSPPPRVESQTGADIKVGAASSWSTSPAVANNFATSERTPQPLRYARQAKPEDVVFYYKASPAMMSTSLGLGEGEIVLRSSANSLKDVKIDRLSKAAPASSETGTDDYDTAFEHFIRKNNEDLLGITDDDA